MPPPAGSAPSGVPPGNADLMFLDEVAALERLGGSSALYATILTSFVGDLAAYPATVQAQLDAQDAAAAARVLHTLKGLAATVGAIYLAEQAIVLERGVKAGTADATATVAALRDLVDAALPVLSDALRRHGAG